MSRRILLIAVFSVILICECRNNPLMGASAYKKEKPKPKQHRPGKASKVKIAKSKPKSVLSTKKKQNTKSISQQKNKKEKFSVMAEIVYSPIEDKPSEQRTVNGPSQYDSRIELNNLNTATSFGEKAKKNSSSVAIVIDKSKLHLVGDGLYQIDIGRTLGESYNLCPGEPFKDEPVVGSGTAFVVDKQKMLTAGHVFEGPLTNYAVVFGFEVLGNNIPINPLILAINVYFPKKVLKQSDDLDIKLFTVDREITQPALSLTNSEQLAIGQEIYMIGHPYGLPKKVAANAGILQTDDLQSFYTSLDAFQGNSGSPVFSITTHSVIGILVSGETDFKWNGTCNISTICKPPYCLGEKAIRIAVIKDFFGL